MGGTAYLLSGGEDRAADGFGQILAEEIKKLAPRPVKILSCFFAKPPTEWERAAKDWEAWLKQNLGDDIVYSFAQFDTFIEQIQEADVIYLHGGDNNTMVQRLTKYSNLAEAWAGKIVVGSSAGASCLAVKFWQRQKQRITSGLGILPYSIMSHYGVDVPGTPKTDWASTEERLRKEGGVDVLRLYEGKLRLLSYE